jgi:hypothetical protein
MNCWDGLELLWKTCTHEVFSWRVVRNCRGSQASWAAWKKIEGKRKTMFKGRNDWWLWMRTLTRGISSTQRRVSANSRLSMRRRLFQKLFAFQFTVDEVQSVLLELDVSKGVWINVHLLWINVHLLLRVQFLFFSTDLYWHLLLRWLFTGFWSSKPSTVTERDVCGYPTRSMLIAIVLFDRENSKDKNRRRCFQGYHGDIGCHTGESSRTIVFHLVCQQNIGDFRLSPCAVQRRWYEAVFSRQEFSVLCENSIGSEQTVRVVREKFIIPNPNTEYSTISNSGFQVSSNWSPSHELRGSWTDVHRNARV